MEVGVATESGLSALQSVEGALKVEVGPVLTLLPSTGDKIVLEKELTPEIAILIRVEVIML